MKGARDVASSRMLKPSSLSRVSRNALRLLVDGLTFVSLGLRSRTQLAAENLFLRKQLAFYRERHVKPHRADDATRLTLVALSHLIEWQAVLTVVKPDTLIRWHRQGSDSSGGGNRGLVADHDSRRICSGSSRSWRVPI